MGSKINAKFWQSILFHEVRCQLTKITGGFSILDENVGNNKDSQLKEITKEGQNCLSAIHFLVCHLSPERSFLGQLINSHDGHFLYHNTRG
jgi:hypothetical protein